MTKLQAEQLRIRQGETVLFIGDSITDAGRQYENPNDLGKGYVLMAAGLLSAARPDLQLTFFNRGIGGNRVGDLEQRWQSDCLDLKPDVVSVLLGINDVARGFDRNEPIPAPEFAERYGKLLTAAKEQLGSRLIILEPFVLPTSDIRRQWREDLDLKIHALRDLAREIGAAYIPLDGLFAQASTQAPCTYWAPDGVHPSPAGHALIASAWLKAAGMGGVIG
ncbi:SGNH/GDSL hydrolase family protein [Paenibacillus sp. GD4]|uniref:SGNH/GDSL hydrolase family protein n=1 Tax=Paenibacillus sp. GD4 TaxID=3068890 RepID=UPI00279647F1|nr:SGNH/GDSL hydrolase family protein [Paenibacillus sp. GD4]MDQ1910269.1 SGNH/GDSL hydrolase family protein [Paenibacillus sp. GD4]